MEERDKQPEGEIKRGKSYDLPAGSSLKAEEPAASYGDLMPLIPSDINKAGILKVLRGNDDSRKLFTDLFEKTGLSLNFLAEKVFEMTPKTIRKYKTEKIKLQARVIEHIVQLMGLYTLGKEIFGSVNEFNEWMSDESVGLGYNVPNQLLNTSTGLSLVYEELKRIEFGATA